MKRLILLVLVTALSSCGGAQSSDEAAPEGIAASHVYSGTEFPHQVAGFRWQGQQVYDAEGMDVSSEYRNRDDVRITAYVYPRPRVHPDPQDDLAAEAQQAVYAMESVHSDFRLQNQADVQVLRGELTTDGVHVHGEGVRLSDGERFEVRTELYLFVEDPWFIKFRASYPAERADTGSAAVQRFLEALGWGAAPGA